MISISPLDGHSPLTPNVQKAGHKPWPTGIRARISNRPYCQLCLPRVLMEAEVYSIVGRERTQWSLPFRYDGLGFFSFRASMNINPFSKIVFPSDRKSVV